MDPSTLQWDAQELHRQLISRAHRILRSLEAAEDVVQEAYVRYLNDHRQGGNIQNPMAWLNVTVRNLAYDAVRRQGTERRHARKQGQSPFPDGGDTDESPLDVLDRRAACRAMIRRLLGVSSTRDAATVLLREIFDTPYRDLAQASGRTEAACRQAVRRTLRRAYKSRAPLTPAIIQSDPLIDSRSGLFEQAVHHGDAQPLIDHLRISSAIACLPAPPVERAYWRPVNQSGRLVFHLVFGAIVLCSSSVRPVLFVPSDAGQ